MSRVMIVDDDPKIRALLAAIVRGEGHEVIEAASTAEALGALEKNPEAVFVDVEMPGESGAQFVVKLRQHLTLGEIPATFVTAYVERVVPLLAAGVAEKKVIKKPFRKSDVVKALRRMVGSASARKNRRVRIDSRVAQAVVDHDRPASIRDLSVGGVYLILPDPQWKAGDIVSVTAQYADLSVTVPARVAHVHANGMGCTFDEDNASTSTQIGNLIECLLSKGALVEEALRSHRNRLHKHLFVAFRGEYRVGQLRDISSSGAFVNVADPPAARSPVTLFIPSLRIGGAAQNPPAIWGCSAEVVRQESNGFACRFLDTSAEFRKAIYDLVE